MSSFAERKQSGSSRRSRKRSTRAAGRTGAARFETTSESRRAARGPERRRVPRLPGVPGEYPFTRGIQRRDVPAHGTGRCASSAGFGDAEESNKRYRFLLDQGPTSLSVAFDHAYTDGPRLRSRARGGEVGKSRAFATDR